MERPIEELIGWTRVCWTDSYAGWWWYGSQYVAGATVDDLAAWLDSRLSYAGWAAYRDCEDWYVDIDCFNHDPATAFTDSLPTLLEALTAAVRKVAGDA